MHCDMEPSVLRVLGVHVPEVVLSEVMDTDSLIAIEEKSLQRHLEWIRHVDGKTHIITGFALAMIGGIAA